MAELNKKQVLIVAELDRRVALCRNFRNGWMQFGQLVTAFAAPNANKGQLETYFLTTRTKLGEAHRILKDALQSDCLIDGDIMDIVSSVTDLTSLYAQSDVAVKELRADWQRVLLSIDKTLGALEDKKARAEAGQKVSVPMAGGKDMAAKEGGKSSRMLSLDVLRGFDMFWIVGADRLAEALKKASGGEEAPPIIKGIADQLEHVSWAGFRFYDMIFPLFVFIVGMSTVFSLGKLLEREGRVAAIKRLSRRAAMLFFMGVLYDVIDGFYHGGLSEAFSDNMLCGVLQRIGLCYLAAGLLFCFLKTRGLIAAFVIILAGYWAALSLVPVPGESQVAFERERNIIHYIDKCIPPYYETDPESLMTTFPAICTCLMGVLVALLLRDGGLSEEEYAKWFLVAGLTLVVLGYAWSMQMPIIKRLWTPSYVFVAGGYSLLLFSLFIYIIDILEWQGWVQPFVWIGANSMGIYFFNKIVDLKVIAGLFVARDSFGPGADVFFALAGLALCMGFVYTLYKKEIFLRV